MVLHWDPGAHHDTFVQSLCPCLGHEDRCDRRLTTPPHHNRPATITVVLHDVTLGVSFSLTSPYSHTSITTRNQKFAFIYKREGFTCVEAANVGDLEQTPDELGGVLL